MEFSSLIGALLRLILSLGSLAVLAIFVNLYGIPNQDPHMIYGRGYLQNVHEGAASGGLAGVIDKSDDSPYQLYRVKNVEKCIENESLD